VAKKSKFASVKTEIKEEQRTAALYTSLLPDKIRKEEDIARRGRVKDLKKKLKK
tara:strand:+ start:448 stop:609 length:162 start_codon:yes stop_codon:yes gene_type:complete